MIQHKLNKLPPYLCRVIARDMSSRGNPLTTAQIADVSGLSKQKVNHISELTSWETVTIGDAESFLKGCGITKLNFRRHVAYVGRTIRSKRPFSHIDKGGPGAKTMHKLAQELNPDSSPPVPE